MRVCVCLFVCECSNVTEFEASVYSAPNVNINGMPVGQNVFSCKQIMQIVRMARTDFMIPSIILSSNCVLSKKEINTEEGN